MRSRNLLPLLILSCGCGPGTTPGTLYAELDPASLPAAPAVLGLASDADAPPPRPEPPLAVEVIHHGPQGPVPGPSAVTVTFNQPMARLGPASTVEAAGPPFVVAPPVSGNFRWASGDTAKLAFKGALTNATRYRVTVPAGVRALAGPRLAKAKSWTFETPRPRLMGVSLLPGEAERHGRLLPSDSFLLSFSQKVAHRAVIPFLSLTTDKKPHHFSATSHGGNPRQVLVQPARPFPAGAAVMLTLYPGWRSLEGPLVSERETGRKFDVYSPLKVEVQCDCQPASPDRACWPMRNGHHQGLVLNFSEPVCRSRLLRALSITPRPVGLARLLRRADHWHDPGEETEADPCGEYWVLDQDLKLHQRYKVRLAGGLTDVFGQRLGQATAASFTTRGLPPGIFLPPQGHGVREPWHPYLLKSVNVKTVNIAVTPMRARALVSFLECRRQSKRSRRTCLAQDATTTRLAVQASGKRDTLRAHEVPLPGALALVELQSPQVVDPQGEPVPHQRLVTRASMGLHARLSAYGLVAWVTSLKKGKGISGAEVEVMDQQGQTLALGRTDAHGLLELSGGKLAPLLDNKAPPRLHLFARREAEEVHLELDGAYGASGSWYTGDEEQDEPMHVDLSAFSAWEGDRPILAGHISTERGIYRPGERVHVHGGVRRFRSWRGEPLAGQEAEVLLQGEGGQTLDRQKLKLSAMGVFTGAFTLPDKGRLDGYRVELVVAGQTLSGHYFRVAQYREPRFTVSMLGPDEIRADQPLKLKIQGRYLFGGAMAGAAYRLSITQRPTSLQVPDHSNYMAGADGSVLGQDRTRWHLSAGTLDAHGKASPSPLPPLTPGGGLDPWPRSLDLEVELSSAARRTAASRAWTQQLPGHRYAGIKDMIAKGETLRHQVKVFEHRKSSMDKSGTFTAPHATPRAGTVQATVHPRLKYDAPPMWSRVIWSKTLRVPAGGQRLAIKWRDEWDKYAGLVLRLRVKDSAGREAFTAQSLTRPDPQETSWRVEDESRQRDLARQEERLTVSTDRDKHLPGQVAMVTVKRRGLAGDTLLLVERERIFQVIPLRFRAGKATLKLPVQQAFADGVTLRAVGLVAGKAMRARLGPVATGSARLRISSEPYQLGVDLKPDKAVYQPGQKVTVKVQVKNGLGQANRAQVVLMAVDEAVLRLTRYALPDPYHDLVRTPRDGVLVNELRHHLLPLRIPVEHQDLSNEDGCSGSMGMGGMGYGGGGGAGSVHSGSAGRMGSSGRPGKKNPRRRFLTTAWHATLVTGPDGTAQASFTLPGNLTTYRLMALAMGEGRTAGSGRSSFRVDLPLLALPALPRFMRPGDKVQAGILLYNTGLAPGKARVVASVSGGAITLQGSSSQEVDLPRGASREVRFSYAAEDVGQARLGFAVSMGGVDDALEQTLPVTQAIAPAAASVSGATTSAVRQGVARLGDLLPSVGGLEVRLASTALTGVEDGVDQLVGYPYGCLEQQSSRVLALTAALVLGERFKLKLPGEPAEMIRAGLRNLLAMQHSDGGFGYWPGSHTSMPWLTAYALVVLHRVQLASRASGVSVPRSPVESALSYLERHARAGTNQERYAFSRRSMILYALSLHGRKVEDLAVALASQRKEEPLFARAMLLAALATDPDTAGDKALATLILEVNNSLRVDGTWAHAEESLHDGYKVLMHSNDRTSAMVLLALLSARPDHPMVPRLVRWFLLGRKKARFRNTQEAAWALLGFWDYARLRETVKPDFQAGVWLGQKRLLTAQFKGHSSAETRARIPMADLLRLAGATARDLVIAKEGAGTLYYVARLRYAPRDLPLAPRDHGFTVRKQVTLLDPGGAALNPARSPRLGETVLVTLKVSSTEARRYVVVEDPLPAGMEALDSTLATGSRAFGAWKLWSSSSSFDHHELRDDRVLFFRDLMQPGTLTYRYLARVTSAGAFIAPPARAEEMYTPEVYGHTGSERVTLAP